MRAVILAAGEGNRLRPYTNGQPKCLARLAGTPLLVHQTETLRDAGITDVTIVTGYRADQIAALGYATRHNPDYASTNMVASLMYAADLLDGGDDVLIAYGDIVYELRVIEALRAGHGPLCTIVDQSWLTLWRVRHDDPLADAETLKLDQAGNIREIGRKATSYDDIEGQYIGLTRVRADTAPALIAAYRRLQENAYPDGRAVAGMYMTDFLQHLIDRGMSVRPVLIDGGWLEVDSASDLDLYNRLHREGRLGDLCRLTQAAAGCSQRW